MDKLPQEELTALRSTLVARRAALLSDIREELSRADESRYIDLAGIVHDAGDQSVADLLVDVDLAMTNQHIGEVRAIEEALRRMNEGGYGFCDMCGERIDSARLSAEPTAIRCIGCQSRYEQQTGGVGGRSL